MKDKEPLDYEEYEISPLFDMIARFFTSVVDGIARLFKNIWWAFLKAFYKLVQLWKMILIAGFSGSIIVAAYFYFMPPTYINELIIIPRFAIEEQLINDIDYLQSLVREKKYNELANKLKITPEQAESIDKIKLDTRYMETEKIRYFDAFVTTIDTTILNAIDLTDLLNDEDLEQAYSRYHINIESENSEIFQSLEEPLLDLIMRNASVARERWQWEENLRTKKEALMIELKELDSLKVAVQDAMREQAKNPSQGSSNIIMGGQFSGGNEFISGLASIFDRSDAYQDEITKIDMLLATEGDVLKIQAHFSPQGIRITPSVFKSFFLGFIDGLGVFLIVGFLRWLYIKGSEL